MIIYVKKQISSILSQYKFGANNQSTRANIFNSISALLRNLVNTNGLSTYNVVCDDTNNNTSTINQGKIIIDLDITPVSEVDSIYINFTMNNDYIEINPGVIVNITAPRSPSLLKATTSFIPYGTQYSANVGFTGIDVTWLGVTNNVGVSGYHVNVIDGDVSTPFEVLGQGTTHFYYPRLLANKSGITFSISAFNKIGDGDVGATLVGADAYISIVENGVPQAGKNGFTGFHWGTAGYFVGSSGELDWSGDNVPRIGYGTADGVTWRLKGLFQDPGAQLETKNLLSNDDITGYTSISSGITLTENPSDTATYSFWRTANTNITGITVFKLDENRTVAPRLVRLASGSLSTAFANAQPGDGTTCSKFWNVSAFFRGNTAPSGSPGLTKDIIHIDITTPQSELRRVFFDITNCQPVAGNYPNPSRGISFGEAGAHFTQRYKNNWCLCSHGTAVTGAYTSGNTPFAFGIGSRDGLGGYTSADYVAGVCQGSIWFAGPGVQYKNFTRGDYPQMSTTDHFLYGQAGWRSYKRPGKYKNNTGTPSLVESRFGMSLYSLNGTSGGYGNTYDMSNLSMTVLVDSSIDAESTKFAGKNLPSSWTSGGWYVGTYSSRLSAGYQSQLLTDDKNRVNSTISGAFGYTGASGVGSQHALYNYGFFKISGITYGYRPSGVGSIASTSSGFTGEVSNAPNREIVSINNKEAYISLNGAVFSQTITGNTLGYIMKANMGFTLATGSTFYGYAGENPSDGIDTTPATDLWWQSGQPNASGVYTLNVRFYNQSYDAASLAGLRNGFTLGTTQLF